MKTRFLIAVTMCVLICGVASAKYAKWRTTDRPPTSLRLALALAEAELEKEPVKYFCIGARLARTFSEGDWEFHFSSTTGQHMWVSVGSDQRIQKTKDGFEY